MRQPALAADRLGERALAVAVDAGDAQHLAEPQLQRHVLDPGLGALAASRRVAQLERDLAAGAGGHVGAVPLGCELELRAARTVAPSRRTSAARFRSRAPLASSSERARWSIAPVTRPPRRTEIRSPSATASCSLWVMKTIASPVCLSRSSTCCSSLTACGVSIEVGSSRISTRDPRHSALMISTCCWRAEREVAGARVRIDLDPEHRAELLEPAARSGDVESHRAAVAEHQVLDHAQRPDQRRVLVDGADPELQRGPRRVDPDLLAGDADDARVGLLHSGQDRPSASTCPHRSRPAGSGPRPRRSASDTSSLATHAGESLA